VSCDDTYKISSYDGNYEKIIKKLDITSSSTESILKIDKNLPKAQKISPKIEFNKNVESSDGKNYTMMNDKNDINVDINNEEILKPLFDLSDAPILDFSAPTTGKIMIEYINICVYTHL
jgi:hypothetical protein